MTAATPAKPITTCSTVAPLQVLQEFYVQATRANRPDAIGHQQAVLLIESFQRFPVQDITSGIMMAALDTHQRFHLSHWDAAIIEASQRWVACKSCPKISTTARTIAASGSPIRSAEKPDTCVVIVCTADSGSTCRFAR